MHEPIAITVYQDALYHQWSSKESAWGRDGQENKMASLRDMSWCKDVRLQEDLRNYVGQNMKRKEMLDFFKKRLSHLGLEYNLQFF